MKIFAVYILANKPRGTLYIGFTNDLKRRMREHRHELLDGFTRKYNVKRLVCYDAFKYVDEAIAREKQLKSWRREWKIALIEERNPEWHDLYEQIFGPEEKQDKMDPESRSG